MREGAEGRGREAVVFFANGDGDGAYKIWRVAGQRGLGKAKSYNAAAVLPCG